MSISLVSEVLEHRPLDLTPDELVVLLAVAEGAQPHDRPRWPARTWGGDLAARCGITNKRLKDVVLPRLARRGLEVRVPLRVDKNGRPVYAYRGHARVYRLPAFDVERGPDTGTLSHQKGAQKHGTFPEERGPDSGSKGALNQGPPTVRTGTTPNPGAHAAAPPAVRTTATGGGTTTPHLDDETRAVAVALANAVPQLGNAAPLAPVLHPYVQQGWTARDILSRAIAVEALPERVHAPARLLQQRCTRYLIGPSPEVENRERLAAQARRNSRWAAEDRVASPPTDEYRAARQRLGVLRADGAAS